MSRDNQRHYFIVCSVIIEIVTPVFRQRIEKDFKSKRFGCLQDFIDSKPVKHILFHLRFQNKKCCQDSNNCKNLRVLPLNYSQWELLYTENPGPPSKPKHHCHCLYTINNVKLDDFDITLASLILLNCCNLTPNEEESIHKLRSFKNKHLSHNTTGAIPEKEFQILWNDLMTYVLRLDASKQDDFIMIQNRPLDESMCKNYFVRVVDFHKKFEQIDTRMQNTETTTADIHSIVTDVQSTMNINNAEFKSETLSKLEIDTRIENIGAHINSSSTKILSKMNINNNELKATLEKVLHQFINNQANNQVDQKKQNEPFKIEQSTFTLHHQIDLTSVDPCCFRVAVTDIVIMDDGRLVMCLPRQNRLLIRDTDGSQIGNIHIHRNPLCVTAVNVSSVAVTLLEIQCIEMYDINNKLKLKSIAVPGMCWCWRGITTINNKLVIGCENKLQIIDHQIGKMVQTIQTDCKPSRLQGSGDRIFYWDHKTINNLCWYSYTDYRHHNLALPSPPRTMSTLQDGSLYVMCLDGSVQHLSSDCKHYEPVKTFQATPVCDELYYNLKQRSLVTIQNKNNHVTVYKEKLTQQVRSAKY